MNYIVGISEVENGYIIKYYSNDIQKTSVFSTLNEVVDFVARYFHKGENLIKTAITYEEWD